MALLCAKSSGRSDTHPNVRLRYDSTMRNHGEGSQVWPVWKQVRSGDAEALGEIAASPRSETLAPRTRPPTGWSHPCAPIAPSDAATSMSKDDKIIDIEGDPDPRSRAAASVPRAPPHSNWSPDRIAYITCCTGARTARNGSRFRSSRRWTWWPSASGKPASPIGRRTTKRAQTAPHPGDRPSGRRHPRQRRELPDQEALHRAGHHPDRKSGPYLTLLHRPQFGDIIRKRRRHHVPAGSAELGLHRHRGLAIWRSATRSASSG